MLGISHVFLLFLTQGLWLAAASGQSQKRVVRNQRRMSSVSASGVLQDEIQEVPMMSPTVHQVLLEVEDMAQTQAAPEHDKIKVIQDIVVNQLMPELKGTRDAAETQVDKNIAVIEKCNANQQTTLKGISSTTEKSVDQHRTEHSACRDEEKVKEGAKDTKCGELDDFLNDVNVPSTMPANKPRAQMVEYVKTMSSYFCPKEPRVTDLNTACKDAEKQHRDQKAECNRDQSTFESDFCQWKTQLNDACSAQTTCYDDAVSAYNSHKVATETLIKKWKVEYSALAKIKCYTDVWLNDQNAKTVDGDQLAKCNADEVDTSPMDVDFKNVPEKAVCDMSAVATYPGSPGFPQKEYASFLKYANEVIPCLGGVVPQGEPDTGYTVPVVPIVPPEPAPPSAGMSLVGNGCCRFDGWQAKNHGYQTEVDCQQICADTTDCIACDTARPRGNKYDCYTFYGKGDNFNLQCGKKSNEQCWKKEVKGGTAPLEDPKSHAAETSEAGMVLVGNGCCRFDGWKGKNHGYQTEMQCQKICSGIDNCVAADIARPRGDKYDCYTFYGSGSNFNLQCGTSNTQEKCYRNVKHIKPGYSN